MNFIAAGLSDVGLQREHNEDSYCILSEHRLFVVADGMGGHRAGDVASHMATTETLLTELELHGIPQLLVYNKADLLDENQRVLALGGRPDAVLVSSIQRESTRPLLALIAEKLKHRWERAQKVPQA